MNFSSSLSVSADKTKPAGDLIDIALYLMIKLENIDISIINFLDDLDITGAIEQHVGRIEVTCNLLLNGCMVVS
jgi:hypothetical protein